MGFSNRAQIFTTPYYLDVESPLDIGLIVAILLQYCQLATISNGRW